MTDWLPMNIAPKEMTIYGLVNGRRRVVRWTKIDHIPLYFWHCWDSVNKKWLLLTNEPSGWLPRGKSNE